MSSLKGILGTEVVSRTDAEKLGAIEGAVVDVTTRSVVGWQVGKGRKALFADHVSFSGIGDAAAVLDTAESLHPAASDAELAAHKGLALLGSLVLSEAGDSLGKVADAEVDTSTGSLSEVSTDTVRIAANYLAGLGSYALTVRLPPA